MTITVTQVGRRVAASGLQATTAHYFLQYLEDHGASLIGMLPADGADEATSSQILNEDIPFLLFEMALCSPEFVGTTGRSAYRRVPYQCFAQSHSVRADRLKRFLLTAPPSRDPGVINGADLAVDWINGQPLSSLEGRFGDLRGGQITSLFSDIAQLMGGFAEILSGATDPSSNLVERANFGAGREEFAMQSRRLIFLIRRLCVRLDKGLPDSAIWMAELTRNENNGRKKRILSNTQILAIWNLNSCNPMEVLDPGRTSDLIRVLRPHHKAADQLVQELRAAVAGWRNAERLTLRDRQKKRLPITCGPTVDAYYSSLGHQFENALNQIFSMLGVDVDERDGHRHNAFPDFVLNLQSKRDTALECKSKSNNNYVDFNDASDVIRKAAVNGLKHSHCITVCQPFVSPDVSRKITQCASLSVIDASDLAEALTRLRLGQLDLNGFRNWITEPGQPRRENIPRSLPTKV